MHLVTLRQVLRDRAEEIPGGADAIVEASKRTAPTVE